MRSIPILLATLLPSAALAHTGHESGSFVSGFNHPFSSADHMLAMVALGLLAAQTGGRALWALPLIFVGAMLFGGALGAAGVGLPIVEPTILASCIVLGALVAMAVRVPLSVMLSAAAVFGTAHGWAHGAEGPANGIMIYAAGFAAATAMLHGLGIAMGKAISATAIRAAGLLTAIGGTALAVAG
ncbi:HupE/UreJ family protein [Paracoccus sp. SCSIO 75233]|uniref:HupE/UreJ family protein n=1 Tax=Paracoccus sp. SCSIO 75233 TaxID=3017782 RepID=UPI0022F08378|nr:HupE/UreJ family protein [Paracoccus sp. SCSIO 75233]WBU52406.1 HupE/UreJ family protein [Paracoccus sp. SCSIO 75233]